MTLVPPPRTPSVAVARVLRDLGLTQGPGKDFRVEGAYRGGERVGTWVSALTRHADETIAARADEIERRLAVGPFPFRVSVYYEGKPRPHTIIANHGERVRQEPPPGTGRAAVLEVAAPPAPAEDPKERALQRRQAKALGWSNGQADIMAAAAAGRLYCYPNGSLRDVAVPGQPGRTVADRRVHQLVTVGLVVEGEPDGSGRRPVRVTGDGRRALMVWKRWCPVPRTQEEEEKWALRPLIGGEQAGRWARRARAEEAARREHTEAFAAAAERQRAWDDREGRMRAAWARVEGIRNPCARRPAGWVPTGEQAAEHRLDPAVLEELRADPSDPQPRPELPSDPGRQADEQPPLVPVEPDEQLNLFGGTAAAML